MTIRLRSFVSFLCSFTVVLLVTAVSSGAAMKAEDEEWLAPAPPADAKYSPAQSTYEFLSAKRYAELLKQARAHVKRNLASIDFEGQLSADIKKPDGIREKILGIKSADEIDPLLRDLEAKFNKLPRDARFLATQLIPIQHLKGIVYRMAPLAAKTRTTHSVLLSTVMAIASSMRIYFPTEQSEALFAYVTEPYDGVVQFQEAEHFQVYVSDKLIPAVEEAADRIQKLLDENGRPMVWDNKILYSKIYEQADSLDRYALVGQPELNALMAGMNLALHNMHMFRAYTVVDLMKMARELGTLYGIDGFNAAVNPLVGGIRGVTAMNRADVVREYRRTFVLYKDGKEHTEIALKHMRDFVNYANAAWLAVKDRPADDTMILNPGFFAGLNRPIGNSLAVWSRMLNGPTAVASRFTGETVRINVVDFYEKPPKDLKSYLPIQPDLRAASDDEKEEYKEIYRYKTVKVAGKETKTKYYNYFRDRARNWNLAAYSGVFPSLKKGDEVGDHVRILSEEWGGIAVSGPLGFVLQ